MKPHFYYILIVTVSFSNAEEFQSVKCPVPGDYVNASQSECVSYSACQYSTNYGCHMRSNEEAGYVIASSPIDTGTGFKVVLKKIDPSLTLYYDDVESLLLEVVYHSDQHFQIKITDPIQERYEVPYELNLDPKGSSSPLYTVLVGDPGEPMSISVARVASSNYVFQMVGPLTYENQFIQITTALSSRDFYGIGENYHTSLRHSFGQRTTYPLFASDKNTQDPVDYNHYGSHPYYVNVEDDEGNTHSVLFYNSNAMEYSTFLLDDTSTPAVTIRTIGGVVDMHFFMGPSPEDVNVQYMNTIGLPVLPPYWSLGFTLSRWNYLSTANYRVVRQRMKDAAIPMDVQTFDIDYMDARKDFTFDPVNWSDLPELIDELHADDVKVTLMLDAAIALYYPPSQRGIDMDVFVKWAFNGYVPEDQPPIAGDYIVGKVWPDNHTTFPDYFFENTTDWWTNEIQMLHSTLDFDAIWIDMNEPSNFGTNNHDFVNILFCPDNYLDSPPYATRAAYNILNANQVLSDKTICMTSIHRNGSHNYLHYDVHNLYGLSETKSTSIASESVFPGMRHVILSRSTFVGSGHYAFHWLGDNAATWDQMKLSVIGMIEFNMFGIPMVGADICGFTGAPSEELCARWMQLGSFYPYSRNHNDDRSPDQDPAVWPSVAAISRNYLGIRYSYLPYLYTLIFQSHTQGNSVVRPLFNVFPTDLSCRGIDDQFFWGDAIMIAPILEESAEARTVYFPNAKWYDLNTKMIMDFAGETANVSAPLEIIPFYLRGGKIIPYLGTGNTTVESRATHFGFQIAADSNFYASGELFWDDGVTQSNPSDTFHLTISMTGTPSEESFVYVSSTILNNSPMVGDEYQWNSLEILGLVSDFCPCAFGIDFPDNGEHIVLNSSWMNCTLEADLLQFGLSSDQSSNLGFPINREFVFYMQNFQGTCN